MNLRLSRILGCIFAMLLQASACLAAGLVDEAGGIPFDIDAVFPGYEEIDIQGLQGDYKLRSISSFLAGTQGLSKLESPLWKSTRAPRGRDVLYLLPYKIAAIEYGGISVKTFFNMTNRMQVTAASLFSLPGITNLNDLITTLVPDISAKEFEQLVPLCQDITLQERKLGFLIQGGFAKGPFTLQLNTSLQVGERNFWLSRKNQQAIKALMSSKFGATVDEKELQKEMMKWRVGPGDTRLKVGLNALNMTSYQNDIGFEVILPTSQLMKSSDIGLGKAEVKFDGSGTEKLKNDALKSLKTIRNYLLDPRLGNQGHMGVGCFLEQKVGLFHDMVQLWFRSSYDVLFPNKEERLFMFKQTLKPSDMEDVGHGGKLVNPSTYVGGPAAATSLNDNLVTQFVREYVFPSSFQASIFPGGVTNVVVATSVDFTKRWRGVVGYDFYAQREEQIKRLYGTDVDLSELRVEDARTPGMLQHKIFSEIFYHNKKEKSDLGVGVGGDLTVASKRIGDDWTVYLKVAMSF